MITVTGLQLRKWYEMGITGPEDLQWLLSFYRNEDWSLNIVRAVLTRHLACGEIGITGGC